jgi:hypothetical protein
MTPTNMTDDQFIVEAVTGVVKGQNAKKATGSRNTSAPILTAIPNLPRSHWCCGSGPCKRRQTRQLIVIEYEMRSDTPPRELMALNVTEDPKLMQERRAAMRNVIVTARTGRFSRRLVYRTESASEIGWTQQILPCLANWILEVRRHGRKTKIDVRLWQLH